MDSPSTPRPAILTAAERLQLHGTRTLDDAELISVLLGGTKGTNSTEKAAHALLDQGQLGELAWATPEQLEQVPGIGPARALALAAAFELGRRVGWTPPNRGDHCLNPARVYELFRHEAHADRESFYIVCLDSRSRIIARPRIAEGSLTQCPVEVRVVLREALRVNAHGLIFVHSHPSGDPAPSPSDDEITQRLRSACELSGLVPRDHVIVASGGYFSYIQSGRWLR